MKILEKLVGALSVRRSHLPSTNAEFDVEAQAVQVFESNAQAIYGSVVDGPISVAEVFSAETSSTRGSLATGIPAPASAQFNSNHSLASAANNAEQGIKAASAPPIEEALPVSKEQSNNLLLKTASAPPVEEAVPVSRDNSENYMKKLESAPSTEGKAFANAEDASEYSGPSAPPAPLEETTNIWEVLDPFNSDFMDDNKDSCGEKLSEEELKHLSGLVEAYQLPELMNVPYHLDLHVLNGIYFHDSTYGRLAAAIHLIFLLAAQFINSPIRGPLSAVLFKKILREEPFTRFHFFIARTYNQSTHSYFMFVLSYLFETRQFTTFSALMTLLPKRDLVGKQIFPDTSGSQVVEFFQVDRFKFDLIMPVWLRAMISLERFELLRVLIQTEGGLEYLLGIVEGTDAKIDVMNMALMIDTSNNPELHEAMSVNIEAVLPRFDEKSRQLLSQLIRVRFVADAPMPANYKSLSATALISLLMSGRYQDILSKFKLSEAFPRIIIQNIPERMVELFVRNKSILHTVDLANVPDLMYDEQPDLVARCYDIFDLSSFSLGLRLFIRTPKLVTMFIKHASFADFRAVYGTSQSNFFQSLINTQTILMHKYDSEDLRYYLKLVSNVERNLNLQSFSIDKVKRLLLNPSLFPVPHDARLHLSTDQLFNLVLDDEIYNFLLEFDPSLKNFIISRSGIHTLTETAITRALSFNLPKSLFIYGLKDPQETNFKKMSLSGAYKLEMNQKALAREDMNAFNSQVRACPSTISMKSIDDPDGFLTLILRKSTQSDIKMATLKTAAFIKLAD